AAAGAAGGWGCEGLAGWRVAIHRLLDPISVMTSAVPSGTNDTNSRPDARRATTSQVRLRSSTRHKLLSAQTHSEPSTGSMAIVSGPFEKGTMRAPGARGSASGLVTTVTAPGTSTGLPSSSKSLWKAFSSTAEMKRLDWSLTSSRDRG